jgi:adenylate kinase
LRQALKDEHRTLQLAINFEIEDDRLVERIVGRRVCPNQHGEWHIAFNKPKNDGLCDVCGEALIQRPDDDEAHLRIRLQSYHKETEPLIGYYRGRGLLRSVSALGGFEEITEQIEKIFQEAQV